MSQFSGFVKRHGPAAKCRPAPPATVDAYRNRLPEALIAEWEESGWCAYANELIWLTNPDDLMPPLKQWLGQSSAAIPFARSAFAHVFVWDGDTAHMLDPKYGRLTRIINKIELVFNFVLCRKPYLEDVLNEKLFRQARKKLGPLAYDECYGFEPALALGGPGTLDTLRVVKLREHLSILSQLVDEVEIV